MLSTYIQIDGVTAKMVGRNAMGIIFCVSAVMVLIGIWKNSRGSIASGYGYWILCAGVAWVFRGV